MILVAGLLAFTSVWGQNTTSGWEDESGKIPVKAYLRVENFTLLLKMKTFIYGLIIEFIWMQRFIRPRRMWMI